MRTDPVTEVDASVICGVDLANRAISSLRAICRELHAGTARGRHLRDHLKARGGTRRLAPSRGPFCQDNPPARVSPTEMRGPQNVI
jgi:hypothetical protein